MRFLGFLPIFAKLKKIFSKRRFLPVVPTYDKQFTMLNKRIKFTLGTIFDIYLYTLPIVQSRLKSPISIRYYCFNHNSTDTLQLFLCIYLEKMILKWEDFLFVDITKQKNMTKKYTCE